MLPLECSGFLFSYFSGLCLVKSLISNIPDHMTRLLITWPTSLHNNEVDIREQHDAASQVQLLSVHINFELYRRLWKVMNPIHSHMHTTWQVLLHFCYFLCTSLSRRELTGQVGRLVRPGGNKERQNISTKWRIIVQCNTCSTCTTKLHKILGCII